MNLDFNARNEDVMMVARCPVATMVMPITVAMMVPVFIIPIVIGTIHVSIPIFITMVTIINLVIGTRRK
jgi:hypothetical protein